MCISCSSSNVIEQYNVYQSHVPGIFILLENNRDVMSVTIEKNIRRVFGKIWCNRITISGSNMTVKINWNKIPLTVRRNEVDAWSWVAEHPSIKNEALELIMSVTFTAFPKIGQFRNVVDEVRYHYGKDNASAPTISFTGTVKLHGTNAGVGWDFQGPLIPQSRKRVITVDNDNAGFAKFVVAQEKQIKAIMKKIADLYPPENPSDVLFIYGEWCGKGIQAKVAIAELEPRLVLFNAAYRTNIKDAQGESVKQWVSREILCQVATSAPIYCIYDFPYWTRNITFKQPELGQMQNDIGKLTLAVENECPVAKAFGVSGLGEGIVWTGSFTSPHDGKQHNLRFKVKGEKHSATKVKTLVAVDVEKLKSVQEFITYAATDNRMEQGFDELFTKTETKPTMKNMGEFIKWVRNDIVAEEADTMKASHIEDKDIGKIIAKVARAWFQKKLDDF